MTGVIVPAVGESTCGGYLLNMNFPVLNRKLDMSTQYTIMAPTSDTRENSRLDHCPKAPK